MSNRASYQNLNGISIGKRKATSFASPAQIREINNLIDCLKVARDTPAANVFAVRISDVALQTKKMTQRHLQSTLTTTTQLFK